MTVRARLALRAPLVALAALAATPGAGAGTAEAASTRVSDEQGSTYWAYVVKPGPVRARPRAGARVVGSTDRYTFYGLRDVVVVLRATERDSGWSLVRYPGLGKRTGWVPDSALGPRRFTDTSILIERGRTRLSVLKAGKVVFSTRVGVGASDSPTPAGRTYIRERLVPRERNGLYGVLAFGLSSYSPQRTDWFGGGQVGVHGTNQPALIPGYISNGCVRLRNGAIRRMDRLIGVGTPVLVR